MAKYSNTVEYNINTKLDGSGLTKLQAQIKQLENSMQQMSNRELIDEEKVRSAKTQLEKLNAALTNSFNSSLGILDLSKFRAELDSSGVSASGLQSAFNMMGAEGQVALNGLTTQIANFNGGMERTSSAVDKIFTTFSNTFRWGLISSFFSNFMNNIHQSVDYVKELDDSLTQIMLVTDYNRDAMNQYAKSANEAAKAVSMTTTGMTNASLVFAQQGYNLNQSQELATLSAKLANASQQDTATTSDQITAYMNAYGLQNSIEELTQQMDNWALIANVSAADVGELAQASQRAASMANAVGVSGEQLAAQIATIESVTREAPEQIGNGLKTLYARFSDISAGKEDEDGFTLGKVTSELNKIGVQVFNEMGQIRDVGDIMEDLMVIWDDLDQTSKVAASQALAGKYQVNRFMALMDNSNMYEEYKGATGSAATGTLDQMNEEFANSIEGRTAKLQASLEGLFSTIFDTDDIYPWMDAAQGAVDLLQQFFDALGGGKTVLLGITSLLTQAFSQNIARSINDTIANRNLGQVRQQNIDTVSDTLDRVGIDRTQGIGAYIEATAQQAKLGALSDAQYDAYINNVRQWADASTALAQSEEELTNSINTVNLVFGKVTGETEAAVLSKDGLNTFSATENRASLSNKEIMQRIQGTDFSDVASQAQVVSLALTKVQSQFDTATKDSEELGHSIDWVQDQLHTLSTEMNGYSSTSADNMIQALQQMRIELDENGKLSETSAKQLQKYIREMQQLSVIAANMDETSAKRVMADAGDSAQKIKGNVDFNRTQEQRAGRNAATGQANIDSQQQIKNILDVLNAVQQLTFVWQTFQNLGSLWANEDLSIEEKILQTTMNLTMGVSQLIIAIDTLTKSYKNLREAKTLENAITTISQAQQILSLANLGKENFLILENTAAKKAQTAQTIEAAAAELGFSGASVKLATVLAGLNPVILAVVAALALLGGIGLKHLWDEAKEAEAQQKALSELADQTQETANKLNETVPALNNLYEAYQTTGKASDEFKQSLAEQAELLGINDAALLISQGKYEELKAKIDEATEAVYNNNVALQQAKLDNISSRDLVNNLTEDQKKRYNLTYTVEQTSEGSGYNGGVVTSTIDQSPYQIVKAAQDDIARQQNVINNLTEKRNELVKSGLQADEQTKQALADQISQIDEEISKTSLLLSESKQFVDEHQDILNAVNDINEFTLNNELANPNSIFNEDYDTIKEYIEALGLNGIDSSNIDELIQQYAELAGNEEAAYIAAEKLKTATGNIELKDKTFSQLPKNNYRSEEEQQLVQESLNLDDNEYNIYQTSLVDNNANLEALRDSAIAAEENADSIQKERIALENATKALVKKRNALEEDSKTLENNDEAYERNQKSIEDLNKQIEANRKRINSNLKSSEDYVDQLEDLENKIIETAVGAKELGEVWEDNASVLRDSESDWAQQADAINNLAPGLAHLLNMDLSEIESLPTTFFTNTQNLNDMEAAINGDVYALQRLRGEAAQELLVKAGVDPSSDLYGDMLNLISMANQVLPDLEAGATIDDTNFIATLNEMVASTYAAGGDIEALIASFERLGIQLTQTGTSSVSVPRITLAPREIGAQSTGIGTAIAKGLSMIPEISYEEIPVPTYEYRKTSGGKGFTGGYSPKSSGGGGGGGKKGSCFVAGTPISMLGYYKNIEEIQVDDIVLSYNEKTKTPEFSKVLQTMIHDVIEPIYTLYIKDEQLRVTGIHKFFTTNDIANPNPRWMCAENLCVGDWILFADNTWHVIHKIEVNIEHQTVYNFEVSNNHNYFVGYNQILAHNKGGGGSGKNYDPKSKDPVEKDIDLYEKVNTQLDDVETTLKGIEQEEDRLIGDKARANMNKQIQLLDKEVELQKEKLEIQKKEQADLAKQLTGYGYKFDPDGFIVNYNDIIKSYENRLNNLINQYNASTTEAGQEALDKQIEKLEKEYDKAKEAADRYDQLQGKELQDTLNSIEELQDAIEDLRIDAWKASTEAIDNLKDLRETAAELEGFFSEYESDSPFRDLIVDSEKLNNIWSIGKDEAKAYYDEIIADKEKALKATISEDERAAIEMSIDYFKALRDNLSDTGLNNSLLGLAYQDMLQLKEWFENPNAADNPFGQNVSALRDAYEEAYNKVADMSKEYEKQVEDFRDHMIDAYDDIEDKQDRQIDKFDRIVEKLEQFSDMYTLYYGDESYDMLRDTLQQQGNTLREQLRQQENLYQYWSERYAEAVAIGDEKLMKELEDKMNDAEDRMAELAEDAAKAFADSYENAVKASTQHIIQGTIGDKNFDRLDRNWEWDKDYIDQYRDDVEKAYEMDKLRNKYTDLLNQAQGASLQTQDKIRAQMQEQLALLDGQATVSEYDVKLANAKLEILQKQIALEDAQRNKNQMKLRRDTQGNYRYVYTANQDDVSGAQQDLLDSEYDAYELSKNQQMNNYDNLINAYQKYLSQREEILNNANLSEQEKLDQNAELYDKFLKVVDAAREDFSDAAYGTLDILNWLTLNGTDYTTTAAIDMLNKLLDEQGNIKDETGVIWMDNATYLTDEVIPKISDAVGAADDDIKNRLNELEQNMVGDNGVIPTIVNGIEGEDGLTTALDEAKTSTDGLVVATRDLMEALNGDNGALAEAQAQLQNYLEELNNVKNASSITAQQLRDTQKELDKSQAESLNYKTQLDDLASGKKVIKNGQIVDPNAEKKDNSGSSKSGKNKSNGSRTGFTGWYYSDSWGGGPSGAWYSGEKDAVRISDFSRKSGYGPYNVHLETLDGGHLGWVKENQLFDTGGYTGKWVDGNKRENGKLAFLHQKELVLNAEDTQNILAAVDIVRQMGIGLRNSTMNINSMSGKNLGTIEDTIEQRVEITASFPNATDAEDIRQALIGLSDKAYQYAHRNR